MKPADGGRLPPQEGMADRTSSHRDSLAASCSPASALAGLAVVLRQEDAAGAAGPHFPARAKRFVHLFMNGGPSQVDTFAPSRCWRSTTASRCPTPTSVPNARPPRACAPPSPSRGTANPVCPSPTSSPARRHATPTTCASSARPRRRAQPRAVALADELRRRPAAAAERRFVADLRAWAARTRIARLSWSSAPAACPSSAPPTGVPPSCPLAAGTHIDTQHADVTRLIENIRHTGGTPRAAAASRPGPPAQREAQGRARRRGQLEARIQVLELGLAPIPVRSSRSGVGVRRLA